MELVRKTNPAERSLPHLLVTISEEIAPSIIGTAGHVTEPTLANYLHAWGYSYKKNKKAIFFDGLEREDVIEYRNAWSVRMMEYIKRSDYYQGEEMDCVISPELEEGESRIVFVTHDESTFYANDGKDDLWLREGENYIRKKGTGLSIMVSEFQCSCHGTMKDPETGSTSRVLFKAGTGREGWLTSEYDKAASRHCSKVV